MADHLQPYHHELFTTARLTAAYERLSRMFDRFGIAATFAFVMAFALDEQEREAFADILEPRDGRDDAWMVPYWRARREGRLEGWHVPQALDIARGGGRHEIACHGFCHRSLGDQALSHQGAVAELEAAKRAASMKKADLRTIVFPRNDVGNLDALRACGFVGYRKRLPRLRGRLGKAMNLAEEFNVWPRPQRPEARNGALVAIPSGYFFNWRFGPRRRVPAGVTLRRWSNLLRSSARSGGVVHLWLHPHNLVTAPDTGDVLERVLAEVAESTARGELSVLTQEQYCAERLTAGAA